MAAVDLKPPAFRSRHGSIAYLSNKRASKDLTAITSKSRETIKGGRTRERSRSVATESIINAKYQKSPSLPDGKIVLQMNRHPSSGDEEKKPRVRNARSLKALDRRRQLMRKFKAIAKISIFCIRESKCHILRNKAYDEIGPYLNSLQFTDIAVDDELLFDPSKFKADKQLRISEETKRILTKPWFDRNEKELHYAQVALRNIQAYAEYPVRMQRKIVEVGIYEKYDAKRVVIRQGHPASSFYFILSGSVVVLVYQGDTKVAKPVAYLKKGQTFGELAIIHRTMRQSTIVAKETIELLSLNITDFHNIFMSGGVKSMTDPDHNQFVQSLTIFRGWPINRMAESEDKCVFHYFKRGDVLVKDSNFSEWIVIVKSGSVKVLKKLKRVIPYQSKNPDQIEFKSESKKRGEIEVLNKQRRYILPDIQIPLRPIEHVDELLSKQNLRLDKGFTVLNLKGRDHGNNRQGLLSQSMDSIYTPVNLTPSESNLPVLGDLAKSRPKTSWSVWTQKRKLENVKLPILPTATTGEDSSEHSSATDGNISPEENDVRSSYENLNLISESKESFSQLFGIPEEGGAAIFEDQKIKKGVNRDSKSQSHSQILKKRKTKQEEEEDEILDKLHDKKNTIRTITHVLDAKYRQKDPDDVTVADLDPQFVHIQTLTKGQVFGVSELVLGVQPSFCLVSNGAECIMINKTFYLQHASEALLRNLRQECSPYPTDEDMQVELQVAVDWKAFRNSTFNHTLKRLTRLKGPLA